MRDEMFDRDYQGGRAELNNGIDRLVKAIGGTVLLAFEALHRAEWSAPWKAKRDPAGLS